MNNILLRAKHWQLFMIVFVIPMVFYVGIMGLMIANIANDTPDPSIIISYFPFFLLLMIFTGSVQFGWFWAVGVGLNKVIPPELKLNVKRFKLAFLLVVIAIFGWVYFMWSLMRSVTLVSQNNYNPAITGLMIPCMFLLIVAVFYIYYFVAKTLRTAELKRAINVGDYIGEFFLIYFFPIGIWFLQPKINKLVDGELSRDTLIDVL